MELRVLKYFVAVAREENITRAAERLNITQPTLSRQLKQLEDELEVKLFDRNKHKIALTNDGLLLRRRAQEIIDLSEKTKNEVSHNNEELSGEIAIGCGELRSVDTLAKIIKSFQELHPDVSFNIFSGNSENIKSLMNQGLLELGLLMEPVQIDRFDFVRMDIDEKWGILVKDSSPLANLEFATAADIKNYPLILPGRREINHEIMNWLNIDPDDVKVVSRYNLLYNSSKLVQNDVGVAICLKLDDHYEGLTFVPLQESPILNSVLVWSSGQVFSKTTSAFIEFVKRYLKGI
ncbi:LysR family transcriptional regulator [Companilactobacillus baiquanensis]|uniref:LysR family transcriptional regulator n=1 Tax=Companilactobacillus baiquanensis TaxID=2486005 RepID=A0ABW1UV26_9LACO|nr:LysR family transcriptional regulator [Companilactobacillus baiquanensis]